VTSFVCQLEDQLSGWRARLSLGGRSDRWREGESFVKAQSFVERAGSDFVERAGADTNVGITEMMLSASKIELSPII